MTQAIFTKYHGPARVKGSRIKATSGGGKKSITLAYDDALSSDDNHHNAARALMALCGWYGILIRGHHKDGQVFVVVNDPIHEHILKGR